MLDGEVVVGIVRGVCGSQGHSGVLRVVEDSRKSIRSGRQTFMEVDLSGQEVSRKIGENLRT